MKPILSFYLALAATGLNRPASAVDLLERYPTTLTAGHNSGVGARPWDFTVADIYRVSSFDLKAGKNLNVSLLGPADVGIGYCSEGAVWALLIPRTGATLSSSALTNAEAITNIWFRFHPRELNKLFPPETVSSAGDTNLFGLFRAIASHKFRGSWHVGNEAMIPEPNDLTVDADTQSGIRRFFVVNKDTGTAEYIPAFESQAFKPPPAISAALAASAFDQLWKTFDETYAMFVLRPDVDWSALRDQYRPKALASKSAREFAFLCSDMLKPLRDLHIWLKLAGEEIPVFNRPRQANSNPSAHSTILGDLHESGAVRWTTTSDGIGYIAIYGWNNPQVPATCNAALDQMRDTRGLIVDVRLNGGGSEDQAAQFAGRFLEKPFEYAWSQFRNGPAHTNLTQKFERTIRPRGPWRYDRPVILLIGQKCMSSNESFIGMMTGATNVATMGDRTCGSSGNPKLVNLPLDMTVSVPQWIDYLPEGTPLDERGFTPQIRFKPEPGAFAGDRDDLLAASLARLRGGSSPSK